MMVFLIEMKIYYLCLTIMETNKFIKYAHIINVYSCILFSYLKLIISKTTFTIEYILMQ